MCVIPGGRDIPYDHHHSSSTKKIYKPNYICNKIPDHYDKRDTNVDQNTEINWLETDQLENGKKEEHGVRFKVKVHENNGSNQNGNILDTENIQPISDNTKNHLPSTFVRWNIRFRAIEPEYATTVIFLFIIP